MFHENFVSDICRFFRTLVTFERFLDFSMNINFDFKLKPEEDFVHHSFSDLTVSMRIFQDFPFNFQNKCFCFSVLLPLFLVQNLLSKLISVSKISETCQHLVS